MFPRFLRPIPQPARRAYSIFSKHGGGRYFNSSKPPKVVPQSSAKAPTRVEVAPSDAVSADDAPAAPSVAVTDAATPSSPIPSPAAAPYLFARPDYPPLNARDLRLHQFFALHRPLILAQPSATLFDPAPAIDIGAPMGAAQAQDALAFGGIDDPPEASPEADADAARQLARALVMNSVGSTVIWEDTLRRLGLDVDQGRGEELSKVSAAVVDMDSTKRKRRKKMKKHKLKKRRRATRAQRLKIGR
ncbi:hypothetical protein FA95DRAFT_1577029 [Auriscalpium vulgare]|uniref:Uncharacterized protein n=1 Tax=Auriscalpium vulgare TaxID=40419 RepID=A0ACB8R9T3_9AGAM|nr:hypothetical protein FA95DRAFT_1577029 [Auriscalpium vulgare]